MPSTSQLARLSHAKRCRRPSTQHILLTVPPRGQVPIWDVHPATFPQLKDDKILYRRIQGPLKGPLKAPEGPAKARGLFQYHQKT